MRAPPDSAGIIENARGVALFKGDRAELLQQPVGAQGFLTGVLMDVEHPILTAGVRLMFIESFASAPRARAVFQRACLQNCVTNRFVTSLFDHSS
jgi:hypothetical protein